MAAIFLRWPPFSKMDAIFSHRYLCSLYSEYYCNYSSVLCLLRNHCLVYSFFGVKNPMYCGCIFRRWLPFCMTDDNLVRKETFSELCYLLDICTIRPLKVGQENTLLNLMKNSIWLPFFSKWLSISD